MKPSHECQEQTYMVEAYLDNNWVRLAEKCSDPMSAAIYANAELANNTEFRIIKLVYQIESYGVVKV